MAAVTLDTCRSPGCLLFECVTGSRAYGTDTPESDLDLRGIFVSPREVFFGLRQVEQVSDPGNDETYYEIGRFVELLAKNNPNILEMLFSEAECTRFRHELMDLIRPEMVLSKLCRDTFAGYAMSQVRKARGLNKKIVNPMDGPRKSIMEFCYVAEGQGSIPLSRWLAVRGMKPRHCGLVKVPHMRDVFGIYHDPGESMGYRGIIRSEESTDLSLSSVPKGEEPAGWMNFNQDGYQKYCREYREYHHWLENRNEARYATNVEHGRNYDSKNLMHTFRLLEMAAEIARDRRITVRRPNREFLMRIRAGEFAYDDLIAKAEERILEIEGLYAASDLPECPDREGLESALVRIREQWYGQSW